ncbi:hypothetical protein FEM48_Zijuj01G0327200 [Ziziphus jujuba var. spinosa]|uniref:Acyl-[acyl-carrier-protein] desaturase n=1 Tax=Ziziphus jujuba var. spinosa TaxID=714518 RepID=A0A978W6L9_ZIZJJ|nr:hypothetical protein FEM48_Zijuj01G0327200 [Ziziphus jujuba var. spinosa]
MALTKLHHYNSSSASTSKPSLGFLSLTKFSSSKFNIGVAHFRFRKVQNVKMSNMQGPPHYEADEKAQVWNSMEDWIRDSILPILKPIEKSWQPQQLLPDPASDGFVEQVKELRSRAKELPDDYFVVLVGDMITEEALPTYQARLTVCNGVLDVSGADESPWTTWTRAWSAEENRHGDLLNKYLYLSGRVDMQQVEKTIQYLIASGMKVGIGTNPYCGLIYTAFQERATFISHANTAKLAMKHGDSKLAQICGTIASDEKRHESAYSKIVGKMLEVDPDGIMVAFGYMIRKKITMPAHFMYDGHDQYLFGHFTNIASRIGVYTAMDYVEILEHLLEKWKVAKLTGLSSEGRRAQDYVCGLPERYRKLEERAQSTIIAKTDFVPFSWIFDRQVLA